MRCGQCRILRAGAHYDGHTGLNKIFDTLLALFIGEQGPIAHRPAVDYGGHSYAYEFLSLSHQRSEIGCSVGLARCHQGRDASAEYIATHKVVSF
jgi:hypothetical protein